MKSTTKHILTICGEELVLLGFRKKRRDLFLLTTEEGVYQGISLQHREIAGNIVEIHVFAVAIWEAVEQKYARGLSQKYTLGDSFTSTEIMSAGNSFLFAGHENIDDELMKFRLFISHDVLPQLRLVSNKTKMRNRLETEVSEGAGYPEKLLVIELEENGIAAATEKFGELTNSIREPFLVDRLANFWGNLIS